MISSPPNSLLFTAPGKPHNLLRQSSTRHIPDLSMTLEEIETFTDELELFRKIQKKNDDSIDVTGMDNAKACKKNFLKGEVVEKRK